MKAHASVRLKLRSGKELATVFEALAPELKTATPRAKATLNREDELLVLSLEARDLVALRSALNTYLRWLSSIASTLQVLEAL